MLDGYLKYSGGRCSLDQVDYSCWRQISVECLSCLDVPEQKVDHIGLYNIHDSTISLSLYALLYTI